MGVRGLVADAHGVAIGGGLLQDRKEVRGEDDMGHVVHGHLQHELVQLSCEEEHETDVTVDPIGGQLVCHDTPRSVVDQYVNSIRTA